MFFVFFSIFDFAFFFWHIKFFEPTIEISNNVIRGYTWSRLKLSIYSVLVDLFHWINITSFKNMKPYNLHSILVLINMVSSFVDFAETTFANLRDVLE